jgi:hypothetical protein
VTIDIVHLFEAIQVQKDQGVHSTFSWRSRDCCLKRIIKLSPIGKPRQSILKRKRTDMLLCCETEGGFPLLFNISPYREGQKNQSHNPAQKQRLIELDCSLVHACAIRVLEEVILECQVQTNENDNQEDGEIFETGTIPDHEIPYAHSVHRASHSSPVCQQEHLHELKAPNSPISRNVTVSDR